MTVCVALAALALSSTRVTAHEMRPAYLAVTETPAGEFDVVWKAPVGQAGMLALDPVFGPSCVQESEPRRELTTDAVTSYWHVSCPEGLGNQIGVAGLDRTLTSAFVRVRWVDGRGVEGLVTGTRPFLVTRHAATPAAWAYLDLGVMHILEGLDHLAFVIAVLMIVAGWRRLLATLTAFTIAHSVTLGTSALGWFELPQRPVEAVIAFSIAVAAREAYLVSRGAGGFVARAPWVMAFGFGLLHGFGFANALSQIGLPQDAILGALLLFNVGVEVGQVIVGALFGSILFAIGRQAPRRRIVLVQWVSVILGAASFYWMCERLFI